MLCQLRQRFRRPLRRLRLVRLATLCDGLPGLDPIIREGCVQALPSIGLVMYEAEGSNGLFPLSTHQDSMLLGR